MSTLHLTVGCASFERRFLEDAWRTAFEQAPPFFIGLARLPSGETRYTLEDDRGGICNISATPPASTCFRPGRWKIGRSAARFITTNWLRDQARQMIRGVRVAHPHLTAYGFGTFEREHSPDYERRLREDREDMLTDAACAQFIPAWDWLSRQNRARHLNRRLDSYDLKHKVERWAGRSVDNGVLIAAAVSLGFQVGRAAGGANAYFNIAAR